MSKSLPKGVRSCSGDSPLRRQEIFYDTYYGIIVFYYINRYIQEAILKVLNCSHVRFKSYDRSRHAAQMCALDIAYNYKYSYLAIERIVYIVSWLFRV